MSLTERLREYVRACFSGIWIESSEHQDAIAEINTLCQQEGWQLATWNIATGFSGHDSSIDQEAGDPLSVLRAARGLACENGTVLLVLENFHRFLQSAEIIQEVAQQVVRGKQSRVIVIVLAPIVQLPIEIERLFVIVEHELPNRDQLSEIATSIATEEGELPSGDEFQRVLDAASGLTRYEAEGAFSLSLVREQRLSAELLWEQKSQTLRKSGLLQLYRGTDDFSSLGGMSALKSFAKRALLQSNRANPLKRPRGVILLSPPGCGKSQFCKTLGKETSRPVIQLDVGNLLGSLVGQSEERTRQALSAVDMMQPCILMIDEVEKAFSGASGSGSNDSGVTSRMFGTFLTWLNDHESDVFTVCTANDVSKLPAEFARAERFDGVFFLDLPGRKEKDAVWKIYRETFEIDGDQRQPDDEQWTGAEIRSCCRLAALLDLPLTQAAQNVVPVAITAAESVTNLRTWASNRCLDANHAGIFHHAAANSHARRSVTRASPSKN